MLSLRPLWNSAFWKMAGKGYFHSYGNEKLLQQSHVYFSCAWCKQKYWRERKLCLSEAYLLLCFQKAWMFCNLVSFTWENLQILLGVCVHYTVTALLFVWRSTAVIVLYYSHNFLILRLWLGQVFKHMLTYGHFASHQGVVEVLFSVFLLIFF